MRRRRIALLWDDSFPGADLIDDAKDAIVSELNAIGDCTLLHPEDLSEHLRQSNCLVNLFGPLFPVEQWPTLSEFLKRGSLVNLGGIPFRKPVVRMDDEWVVQTETQTYHRKLMIRQAYTIPAECITSYTASDELALLEDFTDLKGIEEFYSYNVRYSYQPAIPRDGGSSGPMDGQLRPLLHGLDSSGRPAAAPFIALDCLGGDYEGCRLVLGSFKPTPEFWQQPSIPTLVAKLVNFACSRALLMHAMPSLATYYEGEKPSLILRFRSYEEDPSEGEFLNPGHSRTSELKISVHKDEELVDEQTVSLAHLPVLNRTTAPLNVTISPGLYHVTCVLKSSGGYEVSWHTGFWGYDEELLTSGSDLTVNRDYFELDGRTCVITGTTYMSHDVHRKFLWLPNPWLWYQDMRQMKECGINMIRTGIWYALRHLVFDRGVVDEACLRALDAFILSAKANGIAVTYTFFAFIPEEWEGNNPYLDPRSVAAQADYLAALAERYKNVKGVLWDLINEPSVSSRERVWNTRPNYDEYETKLWQTWLQDKYRDIRELWDAWRVSPDSIPSFQAATLPTPEDFGDKRSNGSANALKAIDYYFFQHEVFNTWVDTMTRAIRSTGDTHLITVGQDEGGVETRPAVHYHARHVDYTCIHIWHMNEQILWDCITTKTPHCPNLLQEVGTTYIEDKDTIERRTPEDNAWLLERKLIGGMAGLSSGFIQWPWNTNTMMDSDGEASIGLWRDDGTHKPELNVVEGISNFFRKAEQFMGNRKLEDVCVIIPYSHRYGELPHVPRVLAPEPSMTAIRVLCYQCKAPAYCVGEQHIDEDENIPKLIVLPSAQMLDQSAWTNLLKKVQGGSTLLVTGAPIFDANLRPAPRTKDFGVDAWEQYRFVAREEYMTLNGKEYRLEFPDWKTKAYKKAILCGGSTEQGGVITTGYGSGKIIYCPLPVEGSSELEPIKALYEYAMAEAGIRPLLAEASPSVLVRPIVFDQATLYCLVNDSSRQQTAKIHHKSAQFTVNLEPQRAAMAMIDQEGRLIASYPNNVITT